MSFLIAPLDKFKVWLPPLQTGTANDEGYTDSLAAATEQIQVTTGRVLQKASHTEILSGLQADGKFGELLRLNSAYAPIDTTVPLTITEDGNALASTFSWTPASLADVVVSVGRAVVIPSTPILVRLRTPNYLIGSDPSYRGWSRNTSNISVVWTGGYDDTTMPPSLVRLCCYLAWVNWQEGRQSTTASRSGSGGASRAITRELPLWAQRTLDMWTIK